MISIAFVVQICIAILWAAILVLHARRLVRLTGAVALAVSREQVLRQQLRRAWWWLGREEFWLAVERDALVCLQLTLMLALLGWSMS